MKNLYVFNPDTGSLVPAEEWLKDGDPTRAQFVGFRSGDGILLMTKNPIGYHETFQEAQEHAGRFCYDGPDWKCYDGYDWKFRCMTRREVIDYQDALDEGLRDLIEAIGGDIDGWTWTSDADSKDGWFARRYGAYGAWFFYGGNGALGGTSVYYASRCRAVTLLSVREAD